MNWLVDKINKNESNESVVGKECIFEGTLESADTVIIQGCYIGSTLKADKIVIDKGAQVRTNIFANIFVLEGTLIGNVNASSRVILEPTAKLAGDIISPELISSEGVFFEGNCRISKVGENNQENEAITKSIKAEFQAELSNFTSSTSDS